MCIPSIHVYGQRRLRILQWALSLGKAIGIRIIAGSPICTTLVLNQNCTLETQNHNTQNSSLQPFFESTIRRNLFQVFSVSLCHLKSWLVVLRFQFKRNLIINAHSRLWHAVIVWLIRTWLLNVSKFPWLSGTLPCNPRKSRMSPDTLVAESVVHFPMLPHIFSKTSGTLRRGNRFDLYLAKAGNRNKLLAEGRYLGFVHLVVEKSDAARRKIPRGQIRDRLGYVCLHEP